MARLVSNLLHPWIVRYRLGERNAGQLVIGFALGLVITMTVFSELGLAIG